MQKPKRLFPNDLRFSRRSADRFVTKARTREFVDIDPTSGKPVVRRKVHRPSVAECLAVLVPRIQDSHDLEMERRGHETR
jgi:hypothetical protein